MTLDRLTVLAPEGAWQGEVSSWTSLVVLAALSAEPESFGELAEAVRRYLPEHQFFDQSGQTIGEETVPDEELLRSLNGAYAALRTSEDETARDSAAQEFREVLEAVSRQFPDLTPRCADLQSRLDEVLRQHS